MAEKPFLSDSGNRSACCCTGCVGVVLFLAACLYGLMQNGNGPLDFDTDDRVMEEVRSPDGKYTADVIVRNSRNFAPAEGGDERVILRSSIEPLAFDADKHINSPSVFYDVSAYGITLQWKDNRTLLINADCFSPARASSEVTTDHWQDVKVTYRTCTYR